MYGGVGARADLKSSLDSSSCIESVLGLGRRYGTCSQAPMASHGSRIGRAGWKGRAYVVRGWPCFSWHWSEVELIEPEASMSALPPDPSPITQLLNLVMLIAQSHGQEGHATSFPPITFPPGNDPTPAS